MNRLVRSCLLWLLAAGFVALTLAAVLLVAALIPSPAH